MRIETNTNIKCHRSDGPHWYRTWVFEHMPSVGRLLDELDAGTQPDIFSVMTALSDCVEYLTTRDNEQAAQEPIGCNDTNRVCSNC